MPQNLDNTLFIVQILLETQRRDLYDEHVVPLPVPPLRST